MPNRIVREGILTSERVDRIAGEPATEVFYRRLFSVVDDYGRYTAHPSLLRAALYPLRLDKIAHEDVSGHLEACASAGLIRLYQVDEKPYLEVLDFRQKKRAMRSKYPAPDQQMTSICGSDDPQMTDTCGSCDQQMADMCGSRVVHMRTEARSEKREAEAETQAEVRADGALPSRDWKNDGLRQFIDLYPAKIRLDEAHRQWTSLVDTGEISARSLPEVMAGLTRWRKSKGWEEDDGKYIPSPAKWLRERRWKDHLQPSEPFRPVKRSSEGNDPNVEWIPPWRAAKDAAGTRAGAQRMVDRHPALRKTRYGQF